MNKRLSIILILSIIIVSLTGCHKTNNTTTDTKYKTTHSYETVEATITDLELQHWFAGTHRYKWNIAVYYKPYDLSYTETSWSTGAFNAPSFIFKTKGDTISIEICNEYTNGKLTNQNITKIH